MKSCTHSFVCSISSSQLLDSGQDALCCMQPTPQSLFAGPVAVPPREVSISTISQPICRDLPVGQATSSIRDPDQMATVLSRKSKSGRNIYFEHAKKSWETDPEFFLPDGTSWVEVRHHRRHVFNYPCLHFSVCSHLMILIFWIVQVTEEGNIVAQERGVVFCWLCKLHGKVNSFTTGYIKGKKDALKVTKLSVSNKTNCGGWPELALSIVWRIVSPSKSWASA